MFNLQSLGQHLTLWALTSLSLNKRTESHCHLLHVYSIDRENRNPTSLGFGSLWQTTTFSKRYVKKKAYVSWTIGMEGSGCARQTLLPCNRHYANMHEEENCSQDSALGIDLRILYHMALWQRRVSSRQSTTDRSWGASHTVYSDLPGELLSNKMAFRLQSKCVRVHTYYWHRVIFFCLQTATYLVFFFFFFQLIWVGHWRRLAWLKPQP